MGEAPQAAMAASDEIPAAPESAQVGLTRELARVMRLHAERSANPRLAESLDRLATWQAKRLRRTYADLETHPRYAAAIDFFESDLYGREHFAARDADVAKVAPLMTMMLPVRVVAAIGHAMELNALSQELDRALLARLPAHDRDPTVVEYCDAYRRMGGRGARERQIALVAEIGGALDRIVQMPLVHAALTMMRQPARAFGVAALHEFLERGFDAFRQMNGAREFLATIVARETELMEKIMAGARAPFADPLEAEGEPGAPSSAGTVSGSERSGDRSRAAAPKRKPRPPRA
jgi:hypothetical protein